MQETVMYNLAYLLLLLFVLSPMTMSDPSWRGQVELLHTELALFGVYLLSTVAMGCGKYANNLLVQGFIQL